MRSTIRQRSWTDYIYGNTGIIARATGSTSSSTYYYHQDHLGSARLITDSSGNVVSNCTYMPFGELVGCSPSVSWNHYGFTGDFHDSESNTEHTQFRQLSTVQGRWLSPDPWLGSMNLTNPQSLNRYAYVMNGPMNMVDPSGLDYCVEGRQQLDCVGGDGGDGGNPCFGDPLDCFPLPFPIPFPIPNGPGGSTGGGGGGSGSPTTQPNVNPSGKPPLSGETLGIPNTVHIHIPSILQTLGLAPNDPACEFIVCGTSSSGITTATFPQVIGWTGEIAARLLGVAGIVLSVIFEEGDDIDHNRESQQAGKWSSIPGCNAQYENDRKVCQQKKTRLCWESAAERLAECNASGGAVGWPPLRW